MAQNRQILPLTLTELAFKAFLQARKDFNFKTTPVHDAVIEQQQILKRTPHFLKAIADANPDEVKKFLENCPELAVMAYGTVTTSSGNTYEKVTAIQLAFIVDDDDLCNKTLLPYIKKLPEDLIKKADDQLAKKMAEVEKQRTAFKPYDFSEIVKAITADEMLKDAGKARLETEAALAKFKEDFKPRVIKFGKSFIKEHLLAGYKVCNGRNWATWNGRQLLWFMINIIGSLQCGVEKCCEQEFSQGLIEIVKEKQPLKRSVKLKNWINGVELTYRGSCDSKLLLSRDFFVDISCGAGGQFWELARLNRCDAKDLCRAKRLGMEKFKQKLQQAVHQVVVAQYSHSC